jgi:hypothetical protein
MTSFFVLSRPPEGIGDEQYTEWYDVHHREVLELEGFTAAERFPLALHRSSDGATPGFRFLVRYTIDGPMDDALAALRAAVDGGHMTFPDWYDGVQSAGFVGGEPVDFPDR